MKRVFRACLLGIVFLVPLSTPAQTSTTTLGGYTFLVQSDGTLYRLVSGSGNTSRYDVVFVADGFAESELGHFADTIKAMISELLAIEPFASNACALNFWAVDLVSTSSSTLDCNASGDSTAVTCSYARAGAVCSLSGVPAVDVIYVVLNDDVRYLAYSYPGQGIIASSTRVPYGAILAHELAHVLAGIGDEYQCELCNGSDDGRTYPSTNGEPPYPNLTTQTTAAEVPWSSQVNARLVPTKAINECGGDIIGAWEGGGYYAHGIYRPAEYCLMDGVMCPGRDPFCGVCEELVRTKLQNICSPLTPSDLLAAELWHSRLAEKMKFIWLYEMVVRVPIPTCYVCDPEFYAPNDTILRMKGNVGRGAWLAITDAEGVEIARSGPPTDGVLEVSFPADRLRTYFLTLQSGPPLARTWSSISN